MVILDTVTAMVLTILTLLLILCSIYNSQHLCIIIWVMKVVLFIFLEISYSLKCKRSKVQEIIRLLYIRLLWMLNSGNNQILLYAITIIIIIIIKMGSLQEQLIKLVIFKYYLMNKLYIKTLKVTVIQLLFPYSNLLILTYLRHHQQLTILKMLKNI